MRYLSPENVTALKQRVLMPREFLWVVAKDMNNGSQFPYGFWSGIGNIQAEVLNPDTGRPETRSFEGSGTLIEIDAIPQTVGIEARPINIKMSQLSEGVQNIARGYDLKQARIELYRGLLNTETRLPVAPAFCRFIGFVDEVDITTPKENEEGAISLSCYSHAREVSRFNPDTRSNESQKRRSSNDGFFEDTSTVGEWELFWGQTSGKVATTPWNKRSDQGTVSGL
ncbi:hypothetical protein [Bartonella sp. LJL80]